MNSEHVEQVFVRSYQLQNVIYGLERGLWHELSPQKEFQIDYTRPDTFNYFERVPRKNFGKFIGYEFNMDRLYRSLWLEMAMQRFLQK